MSKTTKNLLKIARSPLKELSKHGDILTISEKIGGFLFRYIFGYGLKYILIPLLALIATPLALIYDLITEKETQKENDKIDLSNKLFEIRKIVDLKTEKIPFGVKNDIALLFGITNTFTEEKLYTKYKEARRKYHPNRHLTGDSQEFVECEKLYEEMIWHWFRSDAEKLNSHNWSRLRTKSYRHNPKFVVNQWVRFDVDNKVGRIAQTSSCKEDGYLIINDELNLRYENIAEEDIKTMESILL